MKRAYLIALLSLLSVASTFAQSKLIDAQSGHLPDPNPSSIATYGKQPITASKSMVVNSRLVAYRSDEYSNGNWAPIDTAHYVYTGTRGNEIFGLYGLDFDSENRLNWDGSSWGNSRLIEKTYDSNNRMVSYTMQNWDGSAWRNYQRELFTYNSNGLIATNILEYWDLGSTNWVSDAKHIYTYDTNGNMLVDEKLEWNTSNSSWTPDVKITNTYNATDQPLTKLEEHYAGNAYIGQERTIWVYTGSNLDTVTDQVFQSVPNTWANQQRIYYTYNSSNQVLTRILERFPAGSWQGELRTTNTYNGQGLWISELRERYVAGGIYRNESKADLTVTANGIITESIGYTWDGTKWVLDLKSVYDYDVAENLILTNYFYWDGASWQESYRKTSSYNSYNQVISDSILRDSPNGTMEPEDRTYYYYESYEDGTNGVTQIPTLYSTVLPNPFTINVAIQLNVTQAGDHTFEVYNLAGQRIHTESRHLMPGQQSIVWEGQEVPKGVYFYKINSVSGVAGGKLMKQ